MQRRMLGRVGIPLSTLVLIVAHGYFHIWGDAEGLGYGQENPLGAVFGPTPVGLFFHVLMEALAITCALWLLWILWRT